MESTGSVLAFVDPLNLEHSLKFSNEDEDDKDLFDSLETIFSRCRELKKDEKG